ncbi:MAG: hypothetical protein FJ302_13225 [Planctomycetes bacterium]|nr:hypothetical protein [Planctomycetota bacterium]
MQRFPKPWFRPSRKTWFVTLEGKQFNLGGDRKLAFERYKALLNQPRQVQVAPDSLVGLIDKFLDWCEKHRATETYEWYRDLLQKFAKTYPDLAVNELKPFHVQEWIDRQTDIKNGTRRNYARAIIRVMWWAQDLGYIDKNPLARFKKPKAGKRETVISSEEFEGILNLIPGDDFKDLIRFAWETGARAAECLAAEQRHVDLKNRRIVFPQSEEKMEREPRVIYLNEAAAEIVVRRMASSGHVFRNSNGQRWTTEAVNCAFNSLQARMGKLAMRAKGLSIAEDDVQQLTQQLKAAWQSRGKPERPDRFFREQARARIWNREAAKHAPKYCLTVIRHSWCHRALRQGLDALTVSMLMGHSDVTMVSEVYSHLSHAPEFLRDAMRRATATITT